MIVVILHFRLIIFIPKFLSLIQQHTNEVATKILCISKNQTHQNVENIKLSNIP